MTKQYLHCLRTSTTASSAPPARVQTWMFSFCWGKVSPVMLVGLSWGLTFKPVLETIWAIPSRQQPWENPACSQTIRWSSSLEHTGPCLLCFKILLLSTSSNATACGGEQIGSASPPSQGSAPPTRGLGQEEGIHLAWIS